jgi:O-antigen/teichoic acid export membrane protein
MPKMLDFQFRKYFSSTLFSSLIGLASGFVTYRFIEPSLLGIWSYFVVYEVYATFSRLGVINGLGRELPYLLGRDEKKKALDLSSTALFYAISSNLVLFFLIPIILNSDFYEADDFKYQLALKVFTARVLFMSYTAYLSVTFRTSKNFNDLSNIQFLLGLLKLVSVLLVYLYGFYGLVIREFVLSFLEMFFFHVKRPLKILPKFRWESLMHLMKIGVPLFAVSYSFSFADTLPRLYIMNFGEVRDLGLFSPILVILGLGLMLPDAISSYMYPKMSYEYGLTGDKNKLWKIVRLTVFSSLVAGLLLFLTVLLTAQYVEYVFPDYKSTAPYLQLISYSLIFVGYKASGLVFSVLKAWRAMFLNALFYIAVCVISLLTLHFLLDDVLKIASISILISYSTCSFFALYLSRRLTRIPNG